MNDANNDAENVTENKVSLTHEQYDMYVAARVERDQLTKECDEQARLNGMGAQREARLLTERDSLRSICRDLMGALEWYSDEANYTYDDEGIYIASAWHGNRLGEKAKEALTAARQALKDGKLSLGEER